MSGRSVRYRRLLWLAALCIAVAPGCGLSSVARSESPQIREIVNLRNNVEILRRSLSESQRDAERYRDLHEVDRAQMDTLGSDLAWLEARYRVLLVHEQQLERDLGAERQISVRRQLELEELKRITAQLSDGSEQGNSRVKQMEGSLRESQVWVDQLLTEKRQLTGEIEALRRAMSGNEEIPSVITDQLASLKTELERTRGEAEQYRTELFETRKARDAAAALFVSAQQSQEAGTKSVFDFLWVWGKDALNDATAGHWPGDTVAFLVIVVLLGGLFLTCFWLLRRMAHYRRELVHATATSGVFVDRRNGPVAVRKPPSATEPSPMSLPLSPGQPMTPPAAPARPTPNMGSAQGGARTVARGVHRPPPALADTPSEERAELLDELEAVLKPTGVMPKEKGAPRAVDDGGDDELLDDLRQMICRNLTPDHED